LTSKASVRQMALRRRNAPAGLDVPLAEQMRVRYIGINLNSNKIE
jgi:hypothetical protein